MASREQEALIVHLAKAAESFGQNLREEGTLDPLTGVYDVFSQTERGFLVRWGNFLFSLDICDIS